MVQPGNAEGSAQIQGAGALQDLTGKIELIDDNIILNEEFKRNVAIPYFKDIYKDLAAQSDSKSKGINKVSILTVSEKLKPVAATEKPDARLNTPQRMLFLFQKFSFAASWVSSALLSNLAFYVL